MAFAPDKGDPFPGKPKGGGGRGGNKNKGSNNVLKFDAFMPGQLGGLAEDLSTGFGGTMANWKGHLRDVTAPMKISLTPGRGGGGGKGGGKNNDPNTNPNDPSKPLPDGPGTDSPRRAVSMAGQPMAIQQQAPMGFLSQQMPQQQVPPTLGYLGNQPMDGAKFQLPPEILAMMRRR